jgi:carboxymethylenebutenolidase
MEGLSIGMVMEDARALLAYADGQAAASKGPVGCVGYCMSGQFALSAAGAFPERVAAAASIYGVKLITDAPDSPHLAVAKAKARIYVAYAEIDSWAPAEMVERFRKAVAGRDNVELEYYPGVEHGFAFPLRPHYDKAAAERHWERLFELFGRLRDGR